jgi:hypothetical protein
LRDWPDDRVKAEMMFVLIEMQGGVPGEVYGLFDTEREASEWHGNEYAGQDCMILPVKAVFYRLKA